MQTIKDILNNHLGKIDSIDLELIIAHIIKKPREFILAHPEFKIIKNYELKIKNCLRRRIKGEPLAYILGEKEFYGRKFKVDKNVLVPRPETEMMVEEALNLIKQESKKTRKQNYIIIDVGAGSGCIIVALAKLLSNYKLKIKNYEFIGIDISKSTLKIARQNAKLHKVDKKIKFFHGNLLEPILKNKKLKIENCKLIIAANLPYLTPLQIKNSPSIKHEPKLALDAGKDGLKYYKKLFQQIKKLKKLCAACYVLCEIDPSQTTKMKKIIKTNFPKSNITIKKDLRGLNRLVIMEI